VVGRFFVNIYLRGEIMDDISKQHKAKLGVVINGHYIYPRHHVSATTEEKYTPGFFKKLMIQLSRRVRV